MRHSFLGALPVGGMAIFVVTRAALPYKAHRILLPKNRSSINPSPLVHCNTRYKSIVIVRNLFRILGYYEANRRPTRTSKSERSPIPLGSEIFLRKIRRGKGDCDS